MWTCVVNSIGGDQIDSAKTRSLHRFDLIKSYQMGLDEKISRQMKNDVIASSRRRSRAKAANAFKEKPE